jgi:hypothetical protein
VIYAGHVMLLTVLNQGRYDGLDTWLKCGDKKYVRSFGGETTWKAKKMGG